MRLVKAFFFCTGDGDGGGKRRNSSWTKRHEADNREEKKLKTRNEN